jgi:aspartyl-tRNA(Asn)/glutamyl-tRNA(Gln) amidotransferase subunit C
MVMAKTDVFTREDVARIAKLSNINLTPHELAFFVQIFADTVEYIKILDEINTQDIQPTFQVTGLTNVFQTKGLSTTLSQKEALQNASECVKDKFSTKGVFDRGH